MDKASTIINSSKENNLIYPKANDKKDFELTGSTVAQFLEETDVNKYWLDSVHYLSKREAECIFYLLQGKSTKDTGRLMKISPRTVECYINNVKNKLNCYYKGDLLDKISNSFFGSNVTKFSLQEFNRISYS